MVLELYPDPYDCANEEIAIARFLGILIEKKFSSNSNRTHTSASSKKERRLEKEFMVNFFGWEQLTQNERTTASLSQFPRTGFAAIAFLAVHCFFAGERDRLSSRMKWSTTFQLGLGLNNFCENNYRLKSAARVITSRSSYNN